MVVSMKLVKLDNKFISEHRISFMRWIIVGPFPYAGDWRFVVDQLKRILKVLVCLILKIKVSVSWRPS